MQISPRFQRAFAGLAVPVLMLSILWTYLNASLENTSHWLHYYGKKWQRGPITRDNFIMFSLFCAHSLSSMHSFSLNRISGWASVLGFFLKQKHVGCKKGQLIWDRGDLFSWEHFSWAVSVSANRDQLIWQASCHKASSKSKLSLNDGFSLLEGYKKQSGKETSKS